MTTQQESRLRRHGSRGPFRDHPQRRCRRHKSTVVTSTVLSRIDERTATVATASSCSGSTAAELPPQPARCWGAFGRNLRSKQRPPLALLMSSAPSLLFCHLITSRSVPATIPWHSGGNRGLTEFLQCSFNCSAVDRAVGNSIPSVSPGSTVPSLVTRSLPSGHTSSLTVVRQPPMSRWVNCGSAATQKPLQPLQQQKFPKSKIGLNFEVGEVTM